MNIKILKKVVFTTLVLVLLLSLVSKNTYAKHKIIKMDGYEIEILENSNGQTVAKLETSDYTYTMTHTMLESDYILEKVKNSSSFTRLILGSSNKIEKYKVDVKTYDDGELVATIENKEDKSDKLKISETSDNIKAQSTLVIGTGPAAVALIKAILAIVGKAIVISGVTYYAASRVATKLKREQKILDITLQLDIIIMFILV